MSAVDLTKLASITELNLISPNGTHIYNYPVSMPNGLTDRFIIDTSVFPIPAETFFFELRGTDSGIESVLLIIEIQRPILSC